MAPEKKTVAVVSTLNLWAIPSFKMFCLLTGT